MATNVALEATHASPHPSELPTRVRKQELTQDSEPSSAAPQPEQELPQQQASEPSSLTSESKPLHMQEADHPQVDKTGRLQTPPVPPHAVKPVAPASHNAAAAQAARGTKRPYTPVPQHIADAAAVLVFDCGYAVPDAVRIVKMPRGGLTKRLQRLGAKRDGRAPVSKRARKSSSSVESQAPATSAAHAATIAANLSVPPHIEDAACVLLFDCGYSVEIVLEIMKVPWGGLEQRLEHLQAHPHERRPSRARPSVSDTVAVAAPAVAPLSSSSSNGPDSAFVDLLLFPDAALPCQRYHWGIGCSRVNCSWLHDQSSSLLQLLKLIKGATVSMDLCVTQITCPEIVHAIRAAQVRGVVVRVILDYELSLDKSSKVEQFAQKNIPVRYGANQTPMRHNFCIIDGKTLLTGSFNWGLDGVLIHASELAIHARGRMLARFASLFDHVWAMDASESQTAVESLRP